MTEKRIPEFQEEGTRWGPVSKHRQTEHCTVEDAKQGLAAGAQRREPGRERATRTRRMAANEDHCWGEETEVWSHSSG